MKSVPSTTPDSGKFDLYLLQAQAMIGQKVSGFDMNKRNKRQTVETPFGTFTYNPDSQMRGGTLDLRGENKGK